MPKKKEENFWFTKKSLPIWLLCAPVALVGSALKQADIDTAKKRKKKMEKNREWFYKYGGWW